MAMSKSTATWLTLWCLLFVAFLHFIPQALAARTLSEGTGTSRWLFSTIGVGGTHSPHGGSGIYEPPQLQIKSLPASFNKMPHCIMRQQQIRRMTNKVASSVIICFFFMASLQSHHFIPHVAASRSLSLSAAEGQGITRNLNRTVQAGPVGGSHSPHGGGAYRQPPELQT